MKIAVIGETRLPVIPRGGGGLGRATFEVATDLLEIGHDVTLFAMPGSEFAGNLRTLPSLPNMVGEYDVLLEYTHAHEFSRNVPNSVNLLGDRECQFTPRNALVESEYMQSAYPGALICPQGCKVDEIPFYADKGDYLLFMGANVGHKQPGVVQELADKVGKEAVFIGPGFREVSEAEKWDILGHALALICPYTIDASPRAPLEAAACGTPTICLAGDGTRAHVAWGVSGIICKNIAAMESAVEWVRDLDSHVMRAWVKEKHDNKVTIRILEKYLQDVVNGAKW